MTSVMTDITTRVQELCRELEEQEDIRILYACESGSRAWGFASRDSDYDVRFIYVRPQAWYLSLNVEHKRDVIERPIVGDLDVVGWDIRKALNLLYKSNPPLIEWIQSPIVYVDQHEVRETLTMLAPFCYSPIASTYHYLHMAKGNYRDYLQGDVVKHKKYLYVLRPLLGVLWIERFATLVPMEFRTLVDTLTADLPALYDAINALVARKQAGEELAEGPRIEVLNAFIEAQLGRFTTVQAPSAAALPSWEALNRYFRNVILMGWSES